MIFEGLKFMLGIGIGSVLLLLVAALGSAVIFQLERLACRRGWIEEPFRSMPKTRINSTVIPFGLRHPTSSPSRSKVE